MRQAKVLNYAEFIELAKENYTKGGDQVVECWAERDFNEYVSEFGPFTETSALQLFKMYRIQEDEMFAMSVGEIY